jgi:hypothetical protein
MKTLSSNQQAFIKLMTESPEQSRRGFELLLQRPHFEEFFDALVEANLFDPGSNPAPVQGDKPSFYWIPFWAPLKYLEAVAKLAGEKSDIQLAEKVMNIVRQVTLWRGADGKPHDSYHTYSAFATILGLVPANVVSLDDVDLIPTWLECRFDRSLVTAAFERGVLLRFLDTNCPDDRRKARRIIEHCTALRWVDDKWGGTEKTPATVVDDFWLKRLISTTATTLGAKSGTEAADIFLTRLRETYSQGSRQNDTSIWRPAIEEHEQNHAWHGPENAFVDGLRDVLMGWSKQDAPSSQVFVEQLLHDRAEIARRVGIHVLDMRFTAFPGTYRKVVSPELFAEGHLHELYALLSHHFQEFSEDEKSATLDAIRNLPPPASSRDPTTVIKYLQRRWLSAIQGIGFADADNWYRELSADPTIGPLGPHPDFRTFMQFSYGSGPTPFPAQELVAFARDGTLVIKLNAFRQTNYSDGPSTDSLVDALAEAVAADPSALLRALPGFTQANRPYQHGVIAGFKKLWETRTNEAPPINWNAAWPQLIDFFESVLSNETLWNESNPEAERGISYRDAVPEVIAQFLCAGTREDEKAYDPPLLSRTWPLIKTLLERSRAQTEFDSRDPMSRAINTPKGKAIEALVNHALRACRVSDK